MSVDGSTTERVVGRPFQKGVSGNPGGRTRAQAETEQSIRALGPAAASSLKIALERGDGWAVTLALAYCLGKPKERLEHTGVDGGPIQTQEVPADTRQSIEEFMVEFRTGVSLPTELVRQERLAERTR